MMCPPPCSRSTASAALVTFTTVDLMPRLRRTAWILLAGLIPSRSAERLSHRAQAGG